MNRTRLAAIVEQALDLMRNGHWGKGRCFHGLGRRYCIRGAIATVITGDPNKTSPMVRSAYAILTAGLGIPLSLLNDTADTFEQLEAAVRKATEVQA